MNAKEYVETIVEPMAARYLAHPGEMDLAFAVCILAFHFVEYGAKDGKFGSKTDLEAKLRSFGPEFEIVHAVATAAKHTTINDKKQQHVGLHVEDAKLSNAAAFSDGAYFSDGTSWADMPEAIQVKTPDGKFSDITFVLPQLLKNLKSLVR